MDSHITLTKETFFNLKTCLSRLDYLGHIYIDIPAPNLELGIQFTLNKWS